MSKKLIISASLLSANWAYFADETKALIAAGVEKIHIDVMDNHYVPNLTFGPRLCECLRKAGITVPLDVHLMVKPVDALISSFASAGASSITIHPESTEHLDRSLSLIAESGCEVGIALNPATSLDYLTHIWARLNLVLIMSVNPGFGGQSFIQGMMEKIKRTKTYLDSLPRDIKIQVDGGVKLDNIKDIIAAGADSVVIGSALFDEKDYAKTIQKFQLKVGA